MHILTFRRLRTMIHLRQPFKEAVSPTEQTQSGSSSQFPSTMMMYLGQSVKESLSSTARWLKGSNAWYHEGVADLLRHEGAALVVHSTGPVASRLVLPHPLTTMRRARMRLRRVARWDFDPAKAAKKLGSLHRSEIDSTFSKALDQRLKRRMKEEMPTRPWSCFDIGDFERRGFGKS